MSLTLLSRISDRQVTAQQGSPANTFGCWLLVSSHSPRTVQERKECLVLCYSLPMTLIQVMKGLRNRLLVSHVTLGCLVALCASDSCWGNKHDEFFYRRHSLSVLSGLSTTWRRPQPDFSWGDEVRRCFLSSNSYLSCVGYAPPPTLHCDLSLPIEVTFGGDILEITSKVGHLPEQI